MNYFSS